MKERPILFSAPMVRAILEGRKTMTRRVVKGGRFLYSSSPDGEIACENGVACFYIDDDHYRYIKCPCGQPGDRLWVREAWRVGAWDESDGCIAIDYMADGFYRKYVDVPDPVYFDKLWIQSANDAEKALGKRDRYEWGHGESPCRIRPSIFMPRWASRITLEIMSVRVERLQDISEDDAEEEGVEIAGFDQLFGCPYHKNYLGGEPFYCGLTESFKSLWESINGPGSWEANPWVWVIEFKRVEASK